MPVAAKIPPPVSPNASILIIIRNSLTTPVSMRAQSWTPVGSAFMDTHVADIEIGGSTAFAGIVANDVRIDLPFAEGTKQKSHQLVLVAGELRLQPGIGLEQKQTTLSDALPYSHCLTVTLQAVSEQPQPMLSNSATSKTLHELIDENAGCQSLRAAMSLAASSLPEQCTLLIPAKLTHELEALSAEELLMRLCTATAVFCAPQSRGVDMMLDGSLLTAEGDGSHIKFTIAAIGELPSLEFRSDMPPLRCSERFQIIYLVTSMPKS